MYEKNPGTWSKRLFGEVVLTIKYLFLNNTQNMLMMFCMIVDRPLGTFSEILRSSEKRTFSTNENSTNEQSSLYLELQQEPCQKIAPLLF